MQGVTDAVGRSAGGIYLYFPTKNALVAELQVEALDFLNSSYLSGQSRFEAFVAAREADPVALTLSRALAAAHFWIASEETLPNEIELARRLFADPRAVSESEEGGRVLVAVLTLLNQSRDRLDDASAEGAIWAGNNVERALVIASAVTGVLITPKLGGWDDTLFDGHRLATQHVHDFFVGWGAERAHLTAAEEHVTAFAAHDHLAPPPEAVPDPP